MRLSLIFFVLTNFLAIYFYPSFRHTGVSVHPQPVNIFVATNGNDSASGSVRSPIKTLHRAQQLLRSLRAKNPDVPVTIFLRGGTYYLDSALVFTPEDNGKGSGRLVLKNYRDEKVTVSGGRRLSLKWTPWKSGVYRAKVPVEYAFDQLFVNGQKQVRARYPNEDSSAAVFNGVAKDALAPARTKTWSHPEGGFIHALQKSHWGSLSYRITGKNKDGGLEVQGGYQINRSHQIDSNAIFVENIKEELDTAHEWYYDAGEQMLYFMPPKGLDIDKAKIEVPVLTGLIILHGDTANPVSNIQFEGISFTHTKETFMFTREPLLRGDWNIFRGGAVLLSGTEHCSFIDCDFESPGGNALFFSDYNRFDTVRQCLIRHAGASGICFVGDPLAVRSPSFNYDDYVPYDLLDKTPGPKSNNFPRDCDVYDNLIYDIGRIEKQTAGVELSMCMNIKVMHNTIYHVPRAGININDGTWGGHIIQGNDVFETVLETGDHGAFNSWGRDRYWSPDRKYMDSLVAKHPELIQLDAIHPVTIRHNRFRCDHGWDIDLDDGSGNYIIDSNLCLNGGIKNREGFYRSVKNNIMVNNTFHPHVWFKDSHDKFMHNIVMRPYAPIGISYWGDTIDYNLFPDSAAYKQARANGTDRHSAVDFPSFYNPQKGDFRVRINDTVRSTGFHNFSMNDFGVRSPRLKAIARQPEMPIPFHPEKAADKEDLFPWSGAVLKNVEDGNEQSALGLPSAEGVYIVRIPVSSTAYKLGFRQNDVILMFGNVTIRSLDDFKKAAARYTHTPTSCKIYRNQKEQLLKIRPE